MVDHDKPEEQGGRDGEHASAADCEPAAAGAAGELQEPLAALRDEVLRARAETDNVRKRAARDVEAAHRYGLERLVGELLPVRDSLDAGLQTPAGADTMALRDGIALTQQMLTAVLTKFGVTEIEPVGEKFNPELHQAMTLQDDATVEPGTILRVMQKGYLLNDRLVRPAMVVIARRALQTEA